MLSGKIDVVELMIKKGANIWAENNEGEQPIHVAAAEDHSDIIVMLAKGGQWNLLNETVKRNQNKIIIPT